MFKSHHGFTLTEMIICVAITAALSAVAVPSVTRVINENRVASGLNEWTEAVALASRTARERSRPVTICRSLDAESTTPTCSSAASGIRGATDWATGWLIFVEGDTTVGVTTYQAGEEIISKQGPLPSPTGITAQSLVPATITFNSVGIPALVAPGVSFAGMAVTFAYTASPPGNSLTRQVCINLTGRVRVISNATACPAGSL